MLGLSEYLSHLAKTLLLAEAEGHRTVGLLYGGSAAGAFIATALATATLVALPGAHPAVMDLPSMARVTKLPIDVLKAKAEATPVFAPGLDNMVQTGGIHAVWDENAPLAPQLAAVLQRPQGEDDRARLGAERGGRPGRRPRSPTGLSRSRRPRIRRRHMAEALQRHTMVTALGHRMGGRDEAGIPRLPASRIIEGWARAGRPLVVRGRPATIPQA